MGAYLFSLIAVRVVTDIHTFEVEPVHRQRQDVPPHVTIVVIFVGVLTRRL